MEEVFSRAEHAVEPGVCDVPPDLDPELWW